MRRLDNRAAARLALSEQTGRRFRAWLRGFAAGINHYIAANRDTLPGVAACSGALGSASRIRPHVRDSRRAAGAASPD